MSILSRQAARRFGLILAASYLLVPPLQVLAAPVFINEIHYDNTGTDTGEAIEIAGPAGTNLTGWGIVLYNGATGLSYSTTPLTGTIPNQGAGFGTVVVNYPTNGIQNGSPDGIALVNSANVVQQFLSYEGSFTATAGPANGQTSTDIGVSEGGSGAVGASLQLQGSGTDSASFFWAADMPNTFGAVNTGQSFSFVPVFINEIHYDNTGTDTGEAIEIAGRAGANLTGWSLVLYNGATGLSYDTIALSGTILDQQGGFGTAFVLAPGLQNGSPDGIALVYNNSIVQQFLSYEGSFTAADGPANGQTSVDILVTEGSTTPVGDSLQLQGIGAIAADFTWSGAIPSTFGAPNTGQSFSALSVPEPATLALLAVALAGFGFSRRKWHCLTSTRDCCVQAARAGRDIPS